jgi:hypothetical protein
VVCTPGAGFSPSGEGYVRFTAFGSHEKTDKALQRIKAWTGDNQVLTAFYKGVHGFTSCTPSCFLKKTDCHEIARFTNKTTANTKQTRPFRLHIENCVRF